MEETLARAAEPSGAWADIALENPVEARVPKVQISQAKGQSLSRGSAEWRRRRLLYLFGLFENVENPSPDCNYRMQRGSSRGGAAARGGGIEPEISRGST